jgi:hypothetical protein
LLKLLKSSELAIDKVDTLLDGPYLRTLPGALPVDGFFAAILTREK